MVERNEQTVQQVEALSRRWADAELRGDTEYLRQLLTDDFVGVGPRGFRPGKDRWIGKFEAGDLTYEGLTWDEVQVRVYGNAAIVVGRERLEATWRGNPAGGDFRVTLIFVSLDGEWRLAGAQLSPIIEGQ
jgi:ketosteroid isomerase-like protein